MELPNSYKEYIKWNLKTGFKIIDFNEGTHGVCNIHQLDEWILSNYDWMYERLGVRIKKNSNYNTIIVFVKDRLLFDIGPRDVGYEKYEKILEST